ncbi:MAG TPA: hypothetical protein VE954_16695 [Oligoflexus sp.]|uniref:hypothetical protein n=1 Tax=Oligoflexus sp. TaxID=1971216 RepID=UPI002D352558|nr:hypothetical protein [Oligoflexus sp.]HYX34738.1 hypothetical protein [Oligoflexus sp.]
MKKSSSKLFLMALPLALSAACGDGTQTSDLDASWQANGVVIRKDAGAAAADIQDTVDLYRQDLGGVNNVGAVGTQAQGHREINWDGVPAAQSAPNLFPGDFFKARGILISAPCNQLQVSAKIGESDVEFGNLNRLLPKLFGTFSPEKLFAPLGSNILEMTFTVPGSLDRATVTSFGAVFTDVDLKNGSKIEYYDQKGKNILTVPVDAVAHANESLSFVGVKFTDGRRIAKVRITNGNVQLGNYVAEGHGKDAVAVDDFLYGEPAKSGGW